MTIVIQHKFWGLKVEEDHFMVGLSFNQKPEHLRIPFDAVVGFVDPSVQFALQFHEDAEFDDDETEHLEEGFDKDFPPDFDDVAPTPDNQDDPEDSPNQTGTDNVVTLDAFRKK
mgnify:CR=1 FL=1